MINVYFLETQYRYMGWHDLFLEVVLHLKEKHNANIIHQFGGHLNIQKFDINLFEPVKIINYNKLYIFRSRSR
jgi:hypothetical protein